MKKGGPKGVNMVILKIPETPGPNGAQIFKIHIFTDFLEQKWSGLPAIFNKFHI